MRSINSHEGLCGTGNCVPSKRVELLWQLCTQWLPLTAHIRTDDHNTLTHNAAAAAVAAAAQEKRSSLIGILTSDSTHFGSAVPRLQCQNIAPSL